EEYSWFAAFADGIEAVLGNIARRETRAIAAGSLFDEHDHIHRSVLLSFAPSSLTSGRWNWERIFCTIASAWRYPFCSSWLSNFWISSYLMLSFCIPTVTKILPRFSVTIARPSSNLTSANVACSVSEGRISDGRSSKAEFAENISIV